MVGLENCDLAPLISNWLFEQRSFLEKFQATSFPASLIFPPPRALGGGKMRGAGNEVEFQVATWLVKPSQAFIPLYWKDLCPDLEDS